MSQYIDLKGDVWQDLGVDKILNLMNGNILFKLNAAVHNGSPMGLLLALTYVP